MQMMEHVCKCEEDFGDSVLPLHMDSEGPSQSIKLGGKCS